MKLSQQKLIYQFLKENEGLEFNHRKIVDAAPKGLGITDYRRRFCDLRQVWGCTCAEDRKSCPAKEHIINTRVNYYKYLGKKISRIVFTPRFDTPKCDPSTLPDWRAVGAFLKGEGPRPNLAAPRMTDFENIREAML